MELFVEIFNGFKLLTILAKKLHLRCLIGSSHASDLGIFSNLHIHWLLCSPVGICSLCISNMIIIVCVHCSFLICFSPMIFILHLKVLPPLPPPPTINHRRVGILFSTIVNAVFVAKLLTSAIFFSNCSVSFVFLTKSVTSGIFFFLVLLFLFSI